MFDLQVCLDEAQMVESTNAKAAEMTKRLTAVNRWCVTGTPVRKQLLGTVQLHFSQTLFDLYGQKTK